jgi:hypothetical protein
MGQRVFNPSEIAGFPPLIANFAMGVLLFLRLANKNYIPISS